MLKILEKLEYNKEKKIKKYEQKLIEEGRAFELDKIIRAEDFQKEIYEKNEELENDTQKKIL